METQNDILMDSIDALGQRPERYQAFTGDLLAEAEDEVLQSIVQEAARELSMPIALVNLVLKEVQFFKAHYGLPADLAAARGTDRNVSFCQFVVRNGEPFEVTNAEEDPRVPQHLVKTHNIRSYLGIPVLANDVIVGSLCVIDVKPRAFTDQERQNLQKFAELVNQRLAILSQSYERLGSPLVGVAASSALAELGHALAPLQSNAAAGRLNTVALGTFLRLLEHTASGGRTPSGHLQRNLQLAHDAVDNCESLFYEIEASAGDAEDVRLALEHVLIQTSATQLSDVAISGRELARRNVELVGGAFLPDLSVNPTIATPRPLAVALVATCLSMIAGRMVALQVSGGLRMEAQVIGAQATLTMQADALPSAALSEIAEELHAHTGGDPSVAVKMEGGTLRLLFATLQNGS